MNSKNSSKNPSEKSSKFSIDHSKKILAAASIAVSAIIAEPAVSGVAANNIQNTEKQYEFPFISGSIDMIGIDKVRQFMQAKNITKKQDAQFAAEVKKIQHRARLPEDGYLGNATYQAFLQEQNNSQTNTTPTPTPNNSPAKIPHETTREELAQMYAKYPDPNNLLQVKLPDVMSNNYYYGRDAGRNLE